MTKRTSILMGGMAAAVALATAGAAGAAPTPLYAGGGTLAEKAYRDLFNAYGSSASGDLCAGRPVCPLASQEVNPNVEGLYVGVGSGNGLKAFDAYDPSLYVSGSKKPDAVPTPSGRDFGAFYGTGTGTSWVPGTGVGPFYPSVTFSGSDAPLGSSDVSAVAALGFGPAIQIPAFVTPIAIPFNPSAGWAPVGGQPPGGSSKVQLSTNTLCGIFTGAITSWTDPAIKADNKGTQLGTGTITVVYRNDSSGTTDIFSVALLNQCGTAAHPTKSTHPVPTQWLTDAGIADNGSAPFYKGSTKFFISVFLAGHLPSNFYNNSAQSGVTGGANGGGGVRTAILANAGSIGYVSPDQTQPSLSTGPAAANVQSYSTFLAGSTPVYMAPTPLGATYAVSSTTPPSFSGSPVPAANPLNWGVTTPTPTSASAYPIAGFTFLDFYSCYKSQAVLTALVGTSAPQGFLAWYYGSSTSTGTPAAILATHGFAPLPGNWITAVKTLLLSPTLAPNVVGKGGCTKNGATKGA